MQALQSLSRFRDTDLALENRNVLAVNPVMALWMKMGGWQSGENRVSHSAKAMRRRILHRFNNLETKVQKAIVTVNPSAHSGLVGRISTKALK